MSDDDEVSVNEALKQVDRLWDVLRRNGTHGRNLGPTKVSKLMARKRLLLLPIIDSYIEAQIGGDSIGVRYPNRRARSSTSRIRAGPAEASQDPNSH